MTSARTKAVVTGAGGFIGTALVRHLVRKDFPVIAVGRNIPPADRQEDQVRWVQADVREAGILNDLLDETTTLIHLAGHASVAGSVKDPVMDFDCNVKAFIDVLESVRDSGAQLLFPSSPSVFASGQPLPLTETALKKPTSPYGAAKLACEGYAQSYHACYGVDIRIARIFNTYGPGMTRFAIFDFWKKALANREQIDILGDGEQVRDYLYIEDTISALLLIATRGEAGEDYNVASGRPMGTADLARAVASAMGIPDIRVNALGRSFPGDIPRWYADINKLNALGFRPETDLQTGLKRTVDWFQKSYP